MVVDDASDDETSSIMTQYQDSRIEHIRLNSNGGAAAARNAGIRQTNGEYIAFLDSDDVWKADKLRRHLDYICAAPERRRLSCTSHTLQHERSGHIETNRFPDGVTRQDILYGCFVSPGSTLIVERTFFDQIGELDERLRRLEDWDWLLRATTVHPLVMFDQPLSEIRVSHGSAQNTAVKKALELITTKYSDYGLSPGTRDYAVFRSGIDHEFAASHYRGGKYLPALCTFARSVARGVILGRGMYIGALRRVRQDIARIVHNSHK
jgi:glycosyltransferase involved in cell wall biosynthesis